MRGTHRHKYTADDCKGKGEIPSLKECSFCETCRLTSFSTSFRWISRIHHYESVYLTLERGERMLSFVSVMVVSPIAKKSSLRLHLY